MGGAIAFDIQGLWDLTVLPNVIDQEYLHFKLFSIGHKQNILSFSNSRLVVLLCNYYHG